MTSNDNCLSDQAFTIFIDIKRNIRLMSDIDFRKTKHKDLLIAKEGLTRAEIENELTQLKSSLLYYIGETN